MLTLAQVRLKKGQLCPAGLGKGLEQAPVGLEQPTRTKNRNKHPLNLFSIIQNFTIIHYFSSCNVKCNVLSLRSQGRWTSQSSFATINYGQTNQKENWLSKLKDRKIASKADKECVCVCMYVCVCVCVCIGMCVCMYVCLCVCVAPKIYTQSITKFNVISKIALGFKIFVLPHITARTSSIFF